MSSSKPPGLHTTLEFYPWVVVRFACRNCRAYAEKRLAVLAEQYGSGETMERLLARFLANCPHRPRTRNGRPKSRDMACGGYCPDLGTTPPPDLPPALSGFTLIQGGKDDLLPATEQPSPLRRRVGEE